MTISMVIAPETETPLIAVTGFVIAFDTVPVELPAA